MAQPITAWIIGLYSSSLLPQANQQFLGAHIDTHCLVNCLVTKWNWGLRHYFIKPYTALKIEKYSITFLVPLNLAIQHFILEIQEGFFFFLNYTY